MPAKAAELCAPAPWSAPGAGARRPPSARRGSRRGGEAGRGGAERRAGRIWLGPRLEELRRRSAKSYWKTEPSTLPGSALGQLRKGHPNAAPLQVQVQVPRAGTERTHRARGKEAPRPVSAEGSAVQGATGRVGASPGLGAPTLTSSRRDRGCCASCLSPDAREMARSRGVGGEECPNPPTCQARAEDGKLRLGVWARASAKLQKEAWRGVRFLERTETGERLGGHLLTVSTLTPVFFPP